MMCKKCLTLIAGLLLLAAMTAGCVKTIGPVQSSETPPLSGLPSAAATASPEDSEAAASPGGATPSGIDQEKAMDGFMVLLKEEGSEKAALDELRRVLPGLSADNAARLILEFEGYQSTHAWAVVDDALVKKIQEGMTEPYDEEILNELSAISDPALKDALQAVSDRGYKIIVPEGMYEAVIDYGVYREFEKYLPPDIAAYIEIMAAESGGRMAEDGAIIIPLEEVYARALACESFETGYPDSVKRDDVKALYCRYINAYFYGLNNTPAFDYESNKLSREFLDSYQKAPAETSGSNLENATVGYLKILKDNDFMLTPAVSDYRKSLTNQLMCTTAVGG